MSLLSQAFMQFFCSERNCFQTFFQVCNNFFSSKATLKLEFFSVSNQRQISLTNRCRCKQLSELKAIVKLQTTQKHQAMLYSYICSLQRNTKIDKWKWLWQDICHHLFISPCPEFFLPSQICHPLYSRSVQLFTILQLEQDKFLQESWL